MKNNGQYISILSDYGFKITFADKTDTLFLRKSLEALIQSEYPIKKVEFIRNEFEGLTKEARGGFYDLICEDEKGNSFIVEMQLGYYKEYIHRAKFYAFQRFNTLVKKGQFKFENLQRIYCIGFLAHGIFPQSEQYYHFATLKNQKDEELDQQITHIIVEIDKFNKKEHEIEFDLDKLIFVMKNLDKIQGDNQLPEFLSEDWIDKAIKKLETSRMTADQRMHFEMTLARNASILKMIENEKIRMREEVRSEVAKEVRDEVAKEVRDEVVKEVRDEVVKEVRDEVAIRLLNTAKKLKNKGIDLKVIAETTGLSESEIGKL